jgi:hypothetical protein
MITLVLYIGSFDHMISLWKGKNPIYFGVIRSKVKVTVARSVNTTAFSKELRSCYLIFRVSSPCLVQTTLQLSVLVRCARRTHQYYELFSIYKQNRNSNPFPKYIISMFSIMDVNHVHIDAYMYCNASFFEILN